MARIGSFASRPEAEVAASMLRARGIPAAVVGDDAGGTIGVNLGAGGYRLDVRDERRAEAQQLLDRPPGDD